MVFVLATEQCRIIVLLSFCILATLLLLIFFSEETTFEEPIFSETTTFEEPKYELVLHKFYVCEIHVPGMGRLGNQIASLIYGMYFGLVMSASVSTDSSWYHHLFGSSDFGKIFLKTPARGWLTPFPTTTNCSGSIDVHGWSDSVVLLRPNSTQAKDMADIVFENMDFKKLTNVDVINLVSLDTCLTIYFRTGDIFTPAGIIAEYLQAPCDYITFVINSYQPQHIVLVYDGEHQHPCMSRVMEHELSSHVIKFEESVGESFSVLVLAKRLVITGHSSFVFMAALLGRNRSILAPIFIDSDGHELETDFRWLLPSLLPANVEIVRFAIQGFERWWGNDAIRRMGEPFEVRSIPSGWSWPTDNRHMTTDSYTLVVEGCELMPLDEVVHVLSALRQSAKRYYKPFERTWLLGGIVVPACHDADEIQRARALFQTDVHAALTAFIELPKILCDQIHATSGGGGLRHVVKHHVVKENPFRSTHILFAHRDDDVDSSIDRLENTELTLTV